MEHGTRTGQAGGVVLVLRSLQAW